MRYLQLLKSQNLHGGGVNVYKYANYNRLVFSIAQFMYREIFLRFIKPLIGRN